MKAWTEEEIELLKAQYATINTDELSEQLGRKPWDLRVKASELKLKKKKWLWSEEDLAYLKEHYPTTPNGELAKTMGRPGAAIRTMAHYFKIKKKPGFRGYGMTDNRVARLMCKDTDGKFVSSALGPELVKSKNLMKLKRMLMRSDKLAGRKKGRNG